MTTKLIPLHEAPELRAWRRRLERTKPELLTPRAKAPASPEPAPLFAPVAPASRKQRLADLEAQERARLVAVWWRREHEGGRDAESPA